MRFLLVRRSFENHLRGRLYQFLPFRFFYFIAPYGAVAESGVSELGEFNGLSVGTGVIAHSQCGFSPFDVVLREEPYAVDAPAVKVTAHLSEKTEAGGFQVVFVEVEGERKLVLIVDIRSLKGLLFRLGYGCRGIYYEKGCGE